MPRQLEARTNQLRSGKRAVKASEARATAPTHPVRAAAAPGPVQLADRILRAQVNPGASIVGVGRRGGLVPGSVNLDGEHGTRVAPCPIGLDLLPVILAQPRLLSFALVLVAQRCAQPVELFDVAFAVRSRCHLTPAPERILATRSGGRVLAQHDVKRHGSESPELVRWRSWWRGSNWRRRRRFRRRCQDRRSRSHARNR